MARIAVIGAGITGTATALFLARAGHDVTLLEQEARAVTGRLDEDFFDWPRPRVPQAIQPHALLSPARAVLKAEVPDVYDHLKRLGAWEQHELDWFDARPAYREGDEHLVLVRTRRVLLETALRSAAQFQSNLRLLQGTRVLGLQTRQTTGRPPQVTGITFAGGQLHADLVVDAAGQRSPVGSWLDGLVARPLRSERHRVGVAYACRWYRMPSGTRPGHRTPYTSASPHALSIAFPSDNDLLGVALVCATKDPTLPALTDPNVFDALAVLFPSSGAWLAEGAEPVGGVHIMAGLHNRWRPTADERGPLVTGLVRVGDALVHTNPTLTQGTTLALRAAQRIAATAGTAAHHYLYADAYGRWAERVLKPWYDLQVIADRDNEARLSGVIAPPVDAEGRLKAARFACALEDPTVMRAWARARHMLTMPDEAFGTDEIRERLTRWLAARPESRPGPSGPTRRQWEQTILDEADAARRPSCRH
ncbi:2-polyprenyl-6-methoxyphenol hydroxylase-like FAD-dependent oxidoreductase [Streptomyces sp. 3330]|uniref:NAD(P)/FAD-dependent oxidoreductase n=1 Tax=Streptomyces sp. 3330 TaxID=2817755 RepID=UPI0028639A5F|nr:FAD-dependent oxidoreductase [Streptomyces sp. 3330]MDR6974314.1 2-polyprenyl-6-methoxyphenol hydroxylase-like FAD-dependent oxidoreductase [Streptomyces sp. 3330]